MELTSQCPFTTWVEICHMTINVWYALARQISPWSVHHFASAWWKLQFWPTCLLSEWSEPLLHLAFRNRHIILLLGGPKNFWGKCTMVNCGTQWVILTELNGWILHELPWNHDSFVRSTLGMCPCMAFIFQYFVKYTALRVPHHFTDEVQLDRCNNVATVFKNSKATSK